MIAVFSDDNTWRLSDAMLAKSACCRFGPLHGAICSYVIVTHGEYPLTVD